MAKKIKTITLLPSSSISKSLIDFLQEELSKIFKMEVEIEIKNLDLAFAHSGERKQYSGEKILDYLKKIRQKNEALLQILSFDLFVPHLNFVFGLASPKHKVAVISTKRLNPNFYGQPKNQKIFYDRTLKEAVHELGHVFGLGHCSDQSCVMYFSNTLAETDYKSSQFCENCHKNFKKGDFYV